MPSQILTKRPIAQRAVELYEREIKARVEPEYVGKVIALDVDSGDYEIDESILSASKRLKERRPQGAFFALRIGYDGMAAIGAKLRRTR